MINPDPALTVVVGTGGPKQTLYTAGKIEGPFKVIPGSPQSHIPGITQQTVVTPNNGVTVLVGTGGPHQSIHHLPNGYDFSRFGSHGIQYPIHTDSGSVEIDNYTRIDNEQRGDIPGHLIMPGQIPVSKEGDGKISSGIC